MDVRALPQDPQFSLLHVLHQRLGYSVAWLQYGRQGDHVLAERWDGEGPTDVGYPVGRGGRPKWMIVAEHLWLGRLQALLGTPDTDDDAVLAVVREIKSQRPVILDTYGNNAVIECPVCRHPYLVSTFPKPGERECPKCQQSVAYARRSDADGMTARVEIKRST